MPSIRVLTLMLAGLAMLGPFSIDTYLPAFDRIAADFAVEGVLMQHTLSIYLLSFGIMSLFWGSMSDSFGRRPVIIASLVIFLVGSIGCALAPSYGWLLFFRALQGTSAGAGRIIGQALARDCFQGAEAQRLFANIAMVFGLAPAIAPVLGGYLSTYVGWRAIFVLLSVLSLLLIVASWRVLPETLPPQSPPAAAAGRHSAQLSACGKERALSARHQRHRAGLCRVRALHLLGGTLHSGHPQIA